MFKKSRYNILKKSAENKSEDLLSKVNRIDSYPQYLVYVLQFLYKIIQTESYEVKYPLSQNQNSV